MRFLVTFFDTVAVSFTTLEAANSYASHCRKRGEFVMVVAE
jgi:hypothetical protein